MKSVNAKFFIKLYLTIFQIIEPTALTFSEVDLPITVVEREINAILNNAEYLKNNSVIEKDGNVTLNLLLVDTEGQQLANVGYKVFFLLLFYKISQL